jgi:sulfur carrier protein
MSSATISIRLNGADREVSAGTTIGQLLQLAGHGERRVAVECNGEIVPRSQHAQTALAHGDQIEIVQAIGGG